MQHNHILSYSIWLPILAGLAMMMLGSDNKANFTRWLALAFSLLAFAVTLPLYTQFDFARGAFQFEEMTPWIPSFNVNYHLESMVSFPQTEKRLVQNQTVYIAAR